MTAFPRWRVGTREPQKKGPGIMTTQGPFFMKKYKEYNEFEKQTTNPYERVYSWFGFKNSKYSILTKTPKKRPFSHDD